MKRWMALGIAAAASAAVCSGCGGGNTGAESAGEQGSGNDTVTIRMAWWGGESRNAKINKMLDAFEASHPGIKVEREYNTETQFVEKVTTQAAGQDAPDVFQASSFYLDDFVARKMYMPMDELVASGKIDLSNFDKVDIEAGQKDGKQYIALWGHIATGIVYNQTMFEEAGVEIPKMGWTWDDYAETCRKLQEKLPEDTWATEDEGGVYRNVECFAVQKGKALFEGNAIGLSKEEMTDWYNRWETLREEGVCPPASIQKEQGNKNLEQSMFGRRKVAMFSTSSNQLTNFQNLTEDKLGIVNYPWIEGAVKETPMIGSGLGIAANSKHPDEAAELINWIINDDEAVAIFCGEHGQPANKKAREVVEPLVSDSQREEYAYMEEMQSAIVPYPAQAAGANSVKTLLTTENEAIAFKQMSTEQAVDDFFQQSGQILNR
ncbi:MAG: ABC transporter substrate-binding protein [Eubacteriales bacterium]|nr:ABC transporter substrate-binding protein [Eubacteriales bacterium]